MAYVLVLCYGDICLDSRIHTLLYVSYLFMYRQLEDSILSILMVGFGVVWGGRSWACSWSCSAIPGFVPCSLILLYRLFYILVGLVGREDLSVVCR